LLAPNKAGKKLPFGTGTARFKRKAAGDVDEYSGPPPPGAYDPESMNKITGALQSLHTSVPSAAFNSRTGLQKQSPAALCRLPEYERVFIICALLNGGARQLCGA